ncbi:DUF2283 domain-containing protein, partial [Candidatus Gottesmanbacteria bacterium]|nr:DUF2283 domain-containing protein [Candidatus Gottesmanbacteria bacterium]
YFKDDNLLVIELSKKPFEYAEMMDDFVVHYTKKNEPVLIEVLDATRFLKETNKVLPRDVRRQIFSV